MHHEQIYLTPEKAEELLSTARCVRNISPALVKMYADDMRAGRWKLTHQGIALNCDGTMRDGQHRCRAVLESGVTIPIMMSVGLEAESVDCIDIGRSRTLGQMSQFYELHYRAMPVTKTFAFKSSCPRVSPGRLHEIYERHRDSIDFAIAHTSASDRPYYHVNILAGILARATKTPGIDIARLAAFPYHIASGETDEAVAALVRKWYTNLHVGKGGGSHLLEVYNKLQNALWYYMQGKNLALLKPDKDDLWPVNL